MNKELIDKAIEENKSVLFSEKFVELEMFNDNEGNAIFEIKLDDNQSLCVTTFELEGLVKIFNENKDLIKYYVDKVEG